MTLLAVGIGACNYMLYNGQLTLTSKLQFSVFYASTIMGITEFLGSLVLFVIIGKIPRKRGLLFCSFMILAITLSVGSYLTFSHNHGGQHVGTLMMVASFLSRLFISAQSFLFQVYIIELFPDRVRTTGVGICSAVGNIGSALSQPLYPFIGRLGISPLLLMSAICIVLIVLYSVSEETLGKPLQEDIGEDKTEDHQEEAFEKI